MNKESGTILIHPAIASLSPNNPAGIDSLLRVVHGDLRFLDLNEGLLLDWMLNKKTLREMVLDQKSNQHFFRNLQRLGLNESRVEEVVEKADEARQAFAMVESYKDFYKYVGYKRILDDAAKIVSAPYISDPEIEYLIINRNTFAYFNSQFKNSRESLVVLSQSANLFERFLHEQAIPKILETNPKIVGLSISHPDQYVFAFQLAHQIRLANPGIITLFGGGTISRRMETWSQDDEINRTIFRTGRGERSGIIDGLVVSEGELAVSQLTAKAVANPDIDIQELFKGVYGTVFNNDGKIVFNALPRTFYPEGLWRRSDVYQHLTRGLMPEERKMHSLVDGRVCTYECATGGCEFCAISKGYLELAKQSVRRLGISQVPVPQTSSETILTFSPEAVDGERGIKIINQRKLGAERMAREIDKGLKWGFSVVDITDEQFTVDQALELSKSLASLGININRQDVVYACYMRIDDAGDKTNYKLKYGKSLPDLLIDPVVAAQLSQGGLKFAQFGLETTYPPKMQSMVKGTSEAKVKRFGMILKNFAEHGIMSHVFVIVGAPMRDSYWNNMEKFAFEQSALGRVPDAEDLEIMETIYNLKFLHDHREYIFTFKHAPYELAYGSPMAERPLDFGLLVDKQQFAYTDLASSIPFSYTEGRGPSILVFEDLMALYSLWKREEMPYQPVVQEFQYSQRIMQELGAETIKTFAQALLSKGEARIDENEVSKKGEILRKLWGKLTSNGQIPNKVQALFPEGFESYDDLYLLAGYLEDLRSKNN